jgi:dTDP-4-amino-4,6-dideoxygalactose transaminase
LDEIVLQRRNLAETYKKLLEGVKGIFTPSDRSNTLTNWQSYCIRIDDSFNTKKIMQQLLDIGISTRRGILCAHMEPAYGVEPWTWNGKDEGKQLDLKESENARDHCILLPLFHEMETKEVEYVCDSLIRTMKHY